MLCCGEGVDRVYDPEAPRVATCNAVLSMKFTPGY